MNATMDSMSKRKSPSAGGSAQQPPAPPGTAQSAPRRSQGSGSETIRIERELAERITIISIRRRVTISELVSPILEAWVNAAWDEEVSKMAKERSGN